MAARPLFVVCGLGNGSGIGGATAKVFSKAGYSVALIARGASGGTQKLADEINASGGEAAAFPVDSYSYAPIHNSFDLIRKRWPNSEIRVALYNVSMALWKPFLDISEEEFEQSLDTNIRAAFAFSREVLLQVKDQPLDSKGKRGTLLYTGATGSIRGNSWTAGFSTGKHALRAFSQSLAKEFNKQNIHVAHTIIDGAVRNDKVLGQHDAEWAKDPDNKLLPESIGEAYLYLVNQDRSSWTWELDLRPAHEKW